MNTSTTTRADLGGLGCLVILNLLVGGLGGPDTDGEANELGVALDQGLDLGILQVVLSVLAQRELQPASGFTQGILGRMCRHRDAPP